MADANKRINLAAPLLSVRRHGGAGAGAEAAGLPPCKPHATPGGVPFGWEHCPGQPKSVRTRRPAPAPDEAARDAKAVVAAAVPVPEESERFSDALSLVDSRLNVNCSITDLGDAGAPAEPSSRGGVMMDRFLPAAQAVAVGSPQCTFRKAGACAAAAAATATGASSQEPARTGDGDSLPRRLPSVEHSPANHVPSNCAKDDDDEWDEHSTRGFASKRCGLLPTRCVKSALLLLNPAPAIRRRGGTRRWRGKRFLSKGGRGQRATNPLMRRPRNGEHLGHDASLKSWKDVYIDSLLRSDRGGGGGGRKVAGTMASELDRTVSELYSDQGEGIRPKASHLGLLLVLDRSEQCAGNHGASAQSFPEAGQPALLLPPPKISRPAKANDGKKFRRDAGYDFPLLLEDKIVASRDIVPLLPLPPPKSPSESWLSRALPSVSNKPPATSFMGIRVQHKKPAPPPWCSSDQTEVTDHARAGQTRIYDLQK